MNKPLTTVLTAIVGLTTPAVAQEAKETVKEPIAAEAVKTEKKATLIISSVLARGYKGGVSLLAIPVENMEKCEEQGAMLVASERLRAPKLGFECVESR